MTPEQYKKYAAKRGLPQATPAKSNKKVVGGTPVSDGVFQASLVNKPAATGTKPIPARRTSAIPEDKLDYFEKRAADNSLNQQEQAQYDQLVATGRIIPPAPAAPVTSKTDKQLNALQKIAENEAYFAKRPDKGVGSGEMAKFLAGLPGATKVANTLGLSDLGRLQEGRAAETTNALKMAEQQAQGYNSQQLAAQRSQALEAISNQSKAAQRRLSSMQAAQGVRGGAAVGQQQALAVQGIQARAGVERDLLAGQLDAQRLGLSQLSNMQQAAQASERDAQQFNLAQAAKEKTIPLTIAAGPYGAQNALKAAQLQADATKAAGGGGGKIICTELHAQGLLEDHIMDADQAFGKMQDIDTMIGYHFWAKHVVKWMRNSDLITFIVYCIAKPWSEHMAYKMGAIDKDNFAGKLLMWIGLPVCKIIGKLVK